MKLSEASEAIIVGSIKEHVTHLNGLLTEAARRGLTVHANLDTIRPQSMGELGNVDYHKITISLYKEI